MESDRLFDRLLIGRATIRDEVASLAHRVYAGISQEPVQAPVTLVCVLDSAFMLMADFAREFQRLESRLYTEFVTVDKDWTSHHQPLPMKIWRQNSRRAIVGTHVVILDCVVSSGDTIRTVARWAVGPPLCANTTRTVALVAVGRPQEADYIGFHLQGQDNVAGYGTDHGSEENRCLDGLYDMGVRCVPLPETQEEDDEQSGSATSRDDG
ncbi:MAG: phosphoribosyltransferase family protein [Chloroflexi bacterium]|nr:phosphoribosyltransferase family protein [Chloroflexota bacterium]